MPPLHLHDVSDCMRAPEIRRIDIDSRPAHRLGHGVVPALLKRKTSARKDGPIARQVTSPFRQHTFDGACHVAWPSEPKIIEVSKSKRQDIRRMFGEDGFPDGQSAV